MALRFVAVDLAGTPDSRALEVPQWMFDLAACSRTRITPSVAVTGAALLELKELLSRVRPGKSAVVFDARHRSLLCAGGADAVCDDSIRHLTLACQSDEVSDRDNERTSRLAVQRLRDL